MKQQFHARGIRGVVGRALPEVVALVVCGFLSFAVASAADWEIALSRAAVLADDAEPLKEIGLRANVESPFYVFVKNQTKGEEKVSIKLTQLGGADGKKALGSPKTIEDVSVPASKGWVRVSLAPPADPKQAAPKGKDAKAAESPPPMIPLSSPFNVSIEVLDKGGKQLAEKTYPAYLLQPNYVVKVEAVEFKTDDNTLFVDVKALLTEPPPVVELVLQPQKIEGLLPGKKEGVYLQKVKANEIAQLVARNLKFNDNKRPENGIVYLTVDGYQRAFALNTTMSTSSRAEPRFDPTPSVRIVPAAIKTKPVDKVGLRLEVDNPPPLPSLKVDLDRANDKKYEQEDVLPSSRQQLVSVSTANPAGALVFKTAVRDWELELNTKGIFGKSSVRVDLVDNDDNKVKAEGFATLVFDDTPPENVLFLLPNKDNPKQLERGQPLKVLATASDPESGISRAVFFLGKPVVKDGVQELPPNVETVPGELSLRDKSVEATAFLPLPTDKKGVMDVSVQFVNGADQSTFQTIKIELVDPAAGGAAAGKRFKIAGTVIQGTSLQPNVDVVLRDEKGAVKATTRTGKDDKRGIYTFINVAPGVYTVSASNTASRTKGQTPVTVEASDVSDVEIKLTR
jgi:hypothetical protein